MRVITFGELMLRLAPEGYERFVQAHCGILSCAARAGKTSFAARNGVKLHIRADLLFVKSIRCAVSEENEHIERLSDPRITICNIYYKIYLCNEVF